MTLRLEQDVSHADWWAGRDDPWQVLVSLGPDCFAAYAQVPMPLEEDDPRLPLLPDVAGNWDDRTLAAALEVLAGHTTTPEDVWSCAWDGFGDERTGPRVRVPHREFFLFHGALHETGGWEPVGSGHVPSPAAVWPADRSWFLAFDVDPDWAGIGGTRDLVEALVADPRLGAREVSWGDLSDPRGDVA